MSGGPLFSVVIPTFNRARLVTGAIESVLEQELDDFEVVVVDDGSTDGTAELLGERFGSERRVRRVAQPHAERAAARNRGLREALGEFVVFLDSDDRLHANHLSVLATAIARMPDANFLATRYELVRDGVHRPSDLARIPDGWHGLSIVLRGNPFACNVCVRRSNPNLVPFRETSRYESEDWVFLVQNLSRDRIWLCPEVTVEMIDHESRTMRGDPASLAESKMAAVRWLEGNAELSKRDMRLLEGHAHRFCALHEHLAGRRAAAARELVRAIRDRGVARGDLRLALVILAGRGPAEAIRSILRRGAGGGSS